MNLRLANHDDLPEILQLYAQLHPNSPAETPEHAASVWNTIFSFPNYFIIVLEDHGLIVSSCTLVVIPNLTHSLRPYGVIENVVTDFAFRGKGYATAVLQHAKLLAQEHGCYKLMLMTGSKQESTLNFYRRAGFNSEDKTAFVQWLSD